MTTHASNLQLLNNTEHRLKFKTGSDINNALIQPTTTHSLSFNGTDQHGIISDLEINDAFTISMWVKLKDYQSSVSVYPLFLKDYVSTGTTDIFLDLGNGRLRASVYDRTGPWATQISCQMAEFLSNDTWHHIMMTYDGAVNDSAIRTFMNGVESTTNVIRSIDNTGSFNSVNSPADTDAYIGWGSLNNRRFKGEMDQIAIWNSDQSSNINSIYTGDSPADLTSLSPDHLFELNNSTDNSTGASTFALHGGGEFKRKYIYATPRYSAQVDGVNDQIGIGYDSNGNLRGDGNMLGITGDSHTFCFWIKPLDPANSTGRFVYNSKIQIDLRTDGFRFYTPGINKQHIHTVTPDTWYFLALSCDGTSHTSYVKSVSHDLSATVEGQSFTTINSGYLTFGPAVEARYDEIATFNSALSASEIDRIYKYGIRGNSNLAGYWRMGDASGGTGIIIPDELGGEDAQLRNGAFFSSDTVPLPSPTLKDPLVGELLFDKTGDPALYVCTDTSGTISKVSGNLEKMGDVPMLKSNDAGFTPTSSFTASNLYYGMSLWFKLPQLSSSNVGNILYVNLGQTAGVYFKTHAGHIFLRSFGYFSSNNPDQWNDPDKLYPSSVNPEIPFEAGKLNNLTYLKTPSPISGEVRSEIWFNGEIIGYNNITSYYPWTPHFQAINPFQDDLGDLLFGDLAFWDQDISSITDRMYDPKGGHKGHQGDYMDLSIQPDHYYKLGSSFNDVGADGTRGLTKTSGGNYEYKNIFGIENS